MILTGFGWAKPVGVNPSYYKDTKKGMALTAAAGPLANLIMAFAALLIYAILHVLCIKLGFGTSVLNGVATFAQLFAIRNLCFMVFNIIPIPPLDGAKVLGMFLTNKAYYTMLRYERYSMLLIMVLSLTGVLNGIIGTGVNFFFNGIINLLNSAINLIL
jgi:Zn-dependent protease